jgi:deoxycytidylate deaminase
MSSGLEETFGRDRLYSPSMAKTSSFHEVFTEKEPELVFAVVAPVGVDLESFQGTFTDVLKQFNYNTNPIRLSSLAERLQLHSTPAAEADESEFRRIDRLMNAGNDLRKAAKRGDILALHAVAEIAKQRTPAGTEPRPLSRTAHLLRSLKHPKEVERLRRIYGAGFFLIGLHSPLLRRLEYLQVQRGMSEQDARDLIRRDQSEVEEFGQQTRKTFHLADVFIAENNSAQLGRFLDLIFRAPFCTPTPDEHAMFLAYAASLRSAEMGRQVGAVVVSSSGEIISTGANDTPRYLGGLYWPGPDDRRDHYYGVDFNDREIRALVENVASAVDPLIPSKNKRALRKVIATTRIDDLIEYGRVVHAEMEALLSCARSGVSTKGGTMFVTTFPCHNCAKHIVAAGITKVIYVEPYPKSKAAELHPDSISLDDPPPADKVSFLPFVGVAARRYFDLFSMKLSSGLELARKRDGKALAWKRHRATPRVGMATWSYLQRERITVAELLESMPFSSNRRNARKGSRNRRSER